MKSTRIRMIGRAGKSKQHPVYTVQRGDKVYTVTPGTREVTRIVETRINERMSRRVERIGGKLMDSLISDALLFAKESE